MNLTETEDYEEFRERQQLKRFEKLNSDDEGLTDEKIAEREETDRMLNSDLVDLFEERGIE